MDKGHDPFEAVRCGQRSRPGSIGTTEKIRPADLNLRVDLSEPPFEEASVKKG